MVLPRLTLSSSLLGGDQVIVKKGSRVLVLGGEQTFYEGEPQSQASVAKWLSTKAYPTFTARPTVCGCGGTPGIYMHIPFQLRNSNLRRRDGPRFVNHGCCHFAAVPHCGFKFEHLTGPQRRVDLPKWQVHRNTPPKWGNPVTLA